MPAHAAVPASRSSSGLWRASLVVLLLFGVAVTSSILPGGLGTDLYTVTSVTILGFTAVGPVVRGARPRRLWVAVPVAAVCMMAAFVTSNLADGKVSPWPVVFVMGSYVALGTLFHRVARGVDREGADAVLLDTTAATVGVTLGAWALAGVLFGARLPMALAWAVLVIGDAIWLGQLAHLIRCRPRYAQLWWRLVAAVLFLSVFDVAALLSVDPTQDRSPVMEVWRIFPQALLASAAWHPQIGVVGQERTTSPRERRRPRTPTVVFAAVVPAIVSLAVPVNDPLDSFVRSVLVGLLLLLLFGRILMTMSTLSEAERASRRRATRDDLTGLLNRSAMVEVLDTRLEQGRRTGSGTAVLFLDCDDFKYVNDTWGHPAGDAILRSVTAALLPQLRSGDVLCRHGGDEFVVIATVDDDVEACRLADRLRAPFGSPLEIHPGRSHRMTPSMGVAVARPGDSLDQADLLRRADIALYLAKERGGAQYALYDAEVHRREQARATLAEALRDAVRDERITVHLQPIVGGRRHEQFVGWEALARWTDPHHGPIPPDVFIPLAEELGLVHELGEIVLRRACLELARLRTLPGRSRAVVSVNLSATQLGRPEFPEIVARSLRAAGLQGRALWLEITETILVDRGPDAVETLRRLRSMGVRLALDDYGTGYASLPTLLRLPIDCVKLDKSLIDRLETDPAVVRQIAALLDLVASLRIPWVLAEGVERREQAEHLQELGCPLVQGWWFGRPVPPEVIVGEHQTSHSGPLFKVALGRPRTTR